MNPADEDGDPEATVTPHPMELHVGQHSVDFVIRPATVDPTGLARSFTCRVEFSDPDDVAALACESSLTGASPFTIDGSGWVVWPMWK